MLHYKLITIDKYENNLLTTQMINKKILVIGEALVDRYISGHADKISPDAPVPNVKIERYDTYIGAIGLVIQFIKSLGGIPEICSIVGEDYEGAEMRVWRTNGDWSTKHLDDPPIFTGTVESGEVEIGDPFSPESGVKLSPEGLVRNYQGLLFLRVTKQLGGGEVEEAWRYLDIGDFSKGLGFDNYPFHLKMSMKLANEETPPEEFDWTIAYERLDAPHKVFAPIMEKD